ncbi:o-succinylbenzoate synthase [Bacillus sp. Marseille-P3661]|uniref:o-succinylbenzoate synthase n=1 Tax=Bacillus sp. Marseille-P3661 TaxID=1936234 RepID=UPI000C818531|nr:o-succinylbenzoate synthase [Bacillus sp. Marseille-P3661]
MKIKSIKLRHLKMRMKFDFTTSFGTLRNKEFILLEAVDEMGRSGWGESVAFTAPWYTEETFRTNWHILEDFLIPVILDKKIEHPDQVTEWFSYIKRNNMAKATIEGAIWDLYAQTTEQSLAQALGGTHKKIEVGVSIGIQKSIDELLKIIEQYIYEGYKRMKVKIKPGWDVNVMKAIRNEFPNLPLMGDANSAYSINDIDTLKALDEFNLMMIEQPLGSDDILDHAVLQKVLKTPICLDESINSFEDARKAIENGSCKIINIKIGRVGGLTVAKRIHDYCQTKGIAVWCGGMLETGIGRAHNVALTSLANFTLPGDTAGSARYWEKDIITPEVMVDNGYIHVPDQPGIGYQIDLNAVNTYTVFEKVYSLA